MKKLLNKFKKRIYKQIKITFLEGNSRDLEVLSGLTSLAAAVSGLYLGASPGLNILFTICVIISLTSVLAAFPINNLKLRHYSNYLLTFVAFTIALVIYQNGGDVTGVGGYTMVGVSCYYSAFKTRLENVRKVR